MHINLFRVTVITKTSQVLEATFRASFTDGFYLDKKKLSETENYLKKQGWVSGNDELISLEKPGEGNMNYVLRASFKDSVSFIIKQSRPWVERYPQFDAPIIRNKVEAQFLELVHLNKKISKYAPRILGVDETSNILITEDIQEAKDLTYVYKKGNGFTKEEVEKVIQFANRLGELVGVDYFPDNIDMRKLNHQHIFELPFLVDNGFNLDEIQLGLQEVSEYCKNDQNLKNKVQKLGEVYLSKGSFLQHGDMYPGSFLISPKGFFVIDPEFAFVGPPEWDIAVFVAHLILAQTETELVNFAIDSYKKPAGFNQLQFCGFIGTEIIRRLIGLAQLPLELTLKEKETLLKDAVGLINQGI